VGHSPILLRHIEGSTSGGDLPADLRYEGFEPVAAAC